MKKIKVAIYSGIIPSTTFIENLVKAVSANNIEVLIFGNKKKHANYNQPGVKSYVSPDLNWKMFPFVFYNILLLRLKSPHNFRLLRNHIYKQSTRKRVRLYFWSKYLPIVHNLPDIFHLQWAINCNEWLFLKELFQVKLILSLRGSQIHYKPLADESLAQKYKKCFPEIDGFHAVSHNIALLASEYGASASKTNVIYSGIDFNLLDRYIKNLLSHKSETLQIISIGRMHWNKGYHFALDALKKFSEKGYKFHYTIIAGLNAEEILYQIEDLEMKHLVTLHKSMSQEKVLEHMKESDLLLLPSFEEGVANVVLEAMAVGLPVISSDCGGMPEVISNRVNGYLYKKRQQSDLVENLEYFMNESPENKLAIVNNAKTYVKKNHTLENLGKNMSLFYKEIYHQSS